MVESMSYREIEDAILLIQKKEVEAIRELRELLVKKLPQAKISDPLIGLYMEKPARNDRRDYVWLQVDLKKEYWLTAFFNDLDDITGNFHTQFGRIAFVHNIHHLKVPEWCGSPNMLVNGMWVVMNHLNTVDPDIKLYDADYDPGRVIDLFLKFLKEQGEEI